MLFVASFPHSGETLRGDEVRETESRDGREGSQRKRATERVIVLFCARTQKRFPCMAPKHSYIRCIITCVKSLNELTTRLSFESIRGTTDGL